MKVQVRGISEKLAPVKLPPKISLLCFLIVTLLALECFWLLPELDKRALAIIAGQSPQDASPHGWYIIFDAIKLVSLIAVGTLGINA